MIHELKCWPEYFNMVLSDKKKFEARLDDRNFKIGDELLLKEWNPDYKVYTGRILHRRIDYVLRDSYIGLKEGYVILSLSKI